MLRNSPKKIVPSYLPKVSDALKLCNSCALARNKASFSFLDVKGTGVELWKDKAKSTGMGVNRK